MPIQIAIADDHKLILSSLKDAIKVTDHLSVCGTYASGEALLEALPELRPDVLILDYHLPDYTGTHLARYITYHHPQIKIIALTGYGNPTLATEMLENGCAGFLMKTSADAAIIIEAVNAVVEGRIYLDSSLKQKFSNSIKDRIEADPKEPVKLTNRELEILDHIAKGLSSQEIADKLDISKRTVDNHRTSILLKSGAKNTADLIRFALEMKLI